MVVDTITESDVTYVRARFNDFITALLFYCRKQSPAFKLNEDSLITGQDLYNGPYTTMTVWD